MNIVRATLTSRNLDSLDLLEDYVPIGKEYWVDIDTERYLVWFRSGQRMRSVLCVRDVVNGGYLPVDVLDIPAKRN